MTCTDVTLGRFFVSKTPGALCQTIVILQGGTPFCPLEILPLRMQFCGGCLILEWNQQDSFNTPWRSGAESRTTWLWGPGPYKLSSLRDYGSHPECWRAEGEHHWAPSSSCSCSHSLHLLQILSPGHKPQKSAGRFRGYKKSGVIWWDGVPQPPWRSVDLGELFL